MKTLKELKKFAETKDKKIIYNRMLGGYQVIDGFYASEVVYTARDEKNKIWVSERDLGILKSYI